MVAEAAGSGRPWRGKDGRGLRPDPVGRGGGACRAATEQDKAEAARKAEDQENVVMKVKEVRVSSRRRQAFPPREEAGL